MISIFEWVALWTYDLAQSVLRTNLQRTARLFRIPVEFAHAIVMASATLAGACCLSGALARTAITWSEPTFSEHMSHRLAKLFVANGAIPILVGFFEKLLPHGLIKLFASFTAKQLLKVFVADLAVFIMIYNLKCLHKVPLVYQGLSIETCR